MRSLICKYLVFLPAIALLFTMTACDSSDDDASDAELFVGEWVVDETMDGSGSVDLPTFSDTFFIFADGGTATIRAVGVDPANTVELSGSYAVNEASNVITVSIAITGLGTVPLTATYAFNGNDGVTLTIGAQTAALLGPLFGTQFDGAVTLTLVRE